MDVVDNEDGTFTVDFGSEGPPVTRKRPPMSADGDLRWLHDDEPHWAESSDTWVEDGRKHGIALGTLQIDTQTGDRPLFYASCMDGCGKRYMAPAYSLRWFSCG